MRSREEVEQRFAAFVDLIERHKAGGPYPDPPAPTPEELAVTAEFAGPSYSGGATYLVVEHPYKSGICFVSTDGQWPFQDNYTIPELVELAKIQQLQIYGLAKIGVHDERLHDDGYVMDAMFFSPIEDYFEEDGEPIIDLDPLPEPVLLKLYDTWYLNIAHLNIEKDRRFVAARRYVQQRIGTVAAANQADA